MEILHLDSGREMRGGQWQVFYLMMGQKTIGLQPRLLARAGSPLYELSEKRGIPVAPLTPWGVHRESAKVRLIHAHDARSHTWAALFGRRPLVVSRRVAFPVKTGVVSRWKYSKAARFLAVSDFVRKELTKAGVPEERIGVVYDGVPVTPKGVLGARLISPAWDDARKPKELALEAARLAGVQLHFSSNLKEDLGTARVLLYLSDLEGLGSAALLAMAAGVPVIASRVGGLPEIVIHNRTGVLVENQPMPVAAAIKLLMEDDSLCVRLGEGGRQLVLDHFTLAHMALSTFHEYKKVAA